MTRWGAFRGKGQARRPALRPRFCVPCNTDRPFRGLRCLVCKRKEPRLSKMGNIPEGRFDSQGEKGRHAELEWLQREGLISNLEHHPPAFKLVVNDVHITTYEADWRYVENGQVVIEDWKGWPNETYPLKKRLMLAVHGIAIRETGPGAGRLRAGRRS